MINIERSGRPNIKKNIRKNKVHPTKAESKRGLLSTSNRIMRSFFLNCLFPFSGWVIGGYWLEGRLIITQRYCANPSFTVVVRWKSLLCEANQSLVPSVAPVAESPKKKR